jgi:hypothetical protein
MALCQNCAIIVVRYSLIVVSFDVPAVCQTIKQHKVRCAQSRCWQYLQRIADRKNTSAVASTSCVEGLCFAVM